MIKYVEMVAKISELPYPCPTFRAYIGAQGRYQLWCSSEGAHVLFGGREVCAPWDALIQALENPESDTNAERIENAIERILRSGMVDGAHHKQWTLDQVLRTLTGNRYERLIRDERAMGYDWDEGTPP